MIISEAPHPHRLTKNRIFRKAAIQNVLTAKSPFNQMARSPKPPSSYKKNPTTPDDYAIVTDENKTSR